MVCQNVVSTNGRLAKTRAGWYVADDAWNVTNDKVWGGIDDEVPF
jgi:hypothetical protein